MSEALVSNLLHRIVLVALTIFLGWLIFKVFARFIAEMGPSEKNPRPGVWLEGNWGGLGGGLSGWRVSNAFIYLILLSLLLGCLSLAIFSLHPATEKKDESQRELKSDGPKKTDEKNNADKKDDGSGAKAVDAKQSDQKHVETEKAESPTDTKSGEKSPTPPTDTETPKINQTPK